jgi:hypothetical protein
VRLAVEAPSVVLQPHGIERRPVAEQFRVPTVRVRRPGGLRFAEFVRGLGVAVAPVQTIDEPPAGVALACA